MPVTFRPFKRAARYVTVAALCAASTWAHAAATIKVDSLTIGSDLTYPPYAYLDAGKPAGFDADFSRLLAGKLSLQPVFVDTRFPDLILGMRARRFDTVASALYVTPERAKLIDYVPYLKTGSSLLVLANSAYAPTGPEALCGKRVASIKGASWTPAAEGLARDLPAQGPGRDQGAGIPDGAGGADGAALAGGRRDDGRRRRGAQHAVADAERGEGQLDFAAVSGGDRPGPQQGRAGTAGAAQKALGEARASGEYAALLSRYGLEAPTDADVQAALAGPRQ